MKKGNISQRGTPRTLGITIKTNNTKEVKSDAKMQREKEFCVSGKEGCGE